MDMIDAMSQTEEQYNGGLITYGEFLVKQIDNISNEIVDYLQRADTYDKQYLEKTCTFEIKPVPQDLPKPMDLPKPPAEIRIKVDKPKCPCCGSRQVIMVNNGSDRYLECDKCHAVTIINPPAKLLKKWGWK